ncbi:unnamed protein product [Bursaphelenchus xylophilus]|uniref:DNA topoisomerase n=1 Tax=Bursaphelenchus xylophilus TaxID=6326 RepID=A0A1I7SS78_BURXY|nr:unnamed protein product [Bursaphelenchus xylophilus]CAG9097960.1 unnamed protein product [Bursaphelenchus xylophilus]
MKVLMVAEKPILAEAIGKILSDGRYQHRKGKNGICPVIEYSSLFMGRPADFKVTSTCGHVMGIDFPAKYNNWNRTDPAQLFDCPTERNEANPKMKMVMHLANEAKGCDCLVLWLDCDKEGENICFEVIDACKDKLKFSGDIMSIVYRAKFSAISNDEIKTAMRNLGKPNLNESLSVDARQELDLRVGCAFTRFQTCYFQDKYGDLDSTLISFGPCQTPTLAFCVQRHDLITQFKPETYYVLKAIAENNGKLLALDWNRERLFDQEAAQMLLARVKSAQNFVVEEISKKEGRKEKPAALNTVELLRVCSSKLGISPAQAMSTAEHLYTRGYISYPRTETSAYPSSFNFYSTIEQQVNGQFGDLAKQVLADGISKPKGGDDKGDHPPITPMKGNDGGISGDGVRVYNYVVQHFLATVMKPCKYTTETLKLNIATEQFTVQSKKVIDPGFTLAMSWLAVSEGESLGNFSKGDKLGLKEVSVMQKETSPPGYLTEAELITLMEKYGIGTDASIPVHVNNICQRNYVTVGANRTLIPTKLGIALIRGYQQVDPELILPSMRSDVETQLNYIAKGQADYETVKGHVLAMFRLKFMYFVENIGEVDQLFEANFTTLANCGKPLSRCGKCRRFMKLVDSRPQRLFCPNCNDTYALPTGKNSQIRLHKERKCPLDDFELLYFHTPGGKLSDTYAFCPYCYNYPPFEGMRKGDGCNNCFHPSCPQSAITQGVSQCLTDCNNRTGVLVLDPQSGPKWRLSCNKCPAVVGVFEGAQKVKVLESKCDFCGALQMTAEYREGKSKLPDGSLKYSGCAFCDFEKKTLNEDCVNLNHAHLNKQIQIGGRSGRGRGRGRGGRGRGITKRGRV